jgi:hypothetical protein
MTRKFKIIKTAAGTVFCCLGLFLLIYFLSPADKSQYIPGDSQLTTLTSYLISDPYYNEGRGKGNSTRFEIKLSGYPGINFQNESVFLRATEWKSIMADVRSGDTVSIKVLKSDFEKLYIKRDSMTFFQQFANHPYNRFAFYSFKFKNKEYVSDLYEAAKNDNNDHLFSRIIMGLAVIGMGLYCFVAKK